MLIWCHLWLVLVCLLASADEDTSWWPAIWGGDTAKSLALVEYPIYEQQIFPITDLGWHWTVLNIEEETEANQLSLDMQFEMVPSIF